AGHTEAAVDLTQMAGLKPGGALVEIMNEDGTMARLPQLIEIAKKFNLKIISIEALIRYRLQKETIIEKGTQVTLPTMHGEFQLIPYRQLSNGLEHVALVKGSWNEHEPVLVRVHSSCITGDIFGSLRCDCGPQLQKAMEMIDNEGKGVIVYLNQEGRGIGLFHKIQAYKLQEEGKDTVEANIELGFKPDERDFGVGASILHDLQLTHIKLITNNPIKRVGLEGYGINIVENIPLHIRPNKFNKKYIETKHEKMGHSAENIIDYTPKKD
ncbi:MAG: GTP cyclohydrolase II, partial [Bacteroidetes bacterium HGW-Bacteroidetes-21]